MGLPLGHAYDRIAEDSQVGPRRLAVDRIGGRLIAVVAVGEQREGEVAACRTADHSHPFRIDAESRGAVPDEPHRA